MQHYNPHASAYNRASDASAGEKSVALPRKSLHNHAPVLHPQAAARNSCENKENLSHGPLSRSSAFAPQQHGYGQAQSQSQASSLARAPPCATVALSFPVDPLADLPPVPVDDFFFTENSLPSATSASAPQQQQQQQQQQYQSGQASSYGRPQYGAAAAGSFRSTFPVTQSQSQLQSQTQTAFQRNSSTFDSYNNNANQGVNDNGFPAASAAAGGAQSYCAATADVSVGFDGTPLVPVASLLPHHVGVFPKYKYFKYVALHAANCYISS